MHCIPLLKYCLDKKHSKKCTIIKENQTAFCPFCFFEDTTNFCFSKQDLSEISQNKLHQTIIDNISSICTNLVPGHQEDCHEFFINFLNSLEAQYLKIEKCQEKDSLINQIFGGIIKSELECCVCSNKLYTYENFKDLSLEIEENCSIQKSLDKYCEVEKLVGFNKFFCSVCNMKTETLKRYEFFKLPHILSIHLKRFNNSFTKVKTRIDIESEIQLKGIGKKWNKIIDQSYSLFGIIDHYGRSLEGGHFIAKVRSWKGVWIQYNNLIVSNTKLALNKNPYTYMLFYKIKKESEINSDSNLIINKKRHNIVILNRNCIRKQV